MKRTPSLVFVFFVILLVSTYFSLVDSHGLAKKQRPTYRPGEVLIKYKAGTSSAAIEHRHAQWGAKTMKAFRHPRVKHLKLPAGMSVEEAIQRMSKDPGVEYVEPNYIWRKCATVPDDTRFSNLWGLNNTGQSVNGTAGTADADIDAPEAWDTTQGDAAFIVAVLDTGVDYNHPDLSDNVLLSGYDFVDDDDDPMDPDGHGSHVAGVIAARGNNTTGISGVCWNIRILPIRVADATGASTSARFIQGLDYAVTNGARIVNYSYGGPGYSQAAYDEISSANGDGVLVFAPAGNETVNNDVTPLYPASYNLPNVISVAASDQNDQLAPWSNYGASSVDVAAPGVNISSTVPATRTVVWSDNFNDGNMDGWTTGGTNNSFAVQNYLGSNRLSDSPAGNYLNDTDSWARAPVLDLSSYHGVTLEFIVRGHLEEDFDYASLETSTNGVDWTDQGAITGDFSDAWYEVIVDLGAYDGQGIVYFRFRLVTDDSFVYDGLYVDNVQVKAASSSYTGSEYAYYSGTSLATPFAAGIAALVWSAEPGLTHLEVKNRVLNGAERKNSLTGKVLTGARVNAYYAVTGETPPAPPPLPTPSGGGGGGGGCFIATAAFGSYSEPHVKILRDFRDRFLTQNAPGRALVSIYYRISPPIADFISQNEPCKMLIRWSLLPLVGASWVALQTGPVIALGWFVLLTILIIRIAPACYRRIHRRG
jgi:subtilisin family serine protease